MAGHPQYSSGKTLSEEELKALTDEQLINSYTVIKCSFKFDLTVKYPSIPCYIDETSTVYPYSGEAILTGPEYILARNQGCEIQVSEIYTVPFQSVPVPDSDEVIYINLPYQRIIKILQFLRRLHKKGTASNAAFKLMANTHYGTIVRGISFKHKNDPRTGMAIKISANEYSNPLIAS